jgi:hypothetical protein
MRKLNELTPGGPPTINFFRARAVIFESASEDPFRFEQATDRIAERYIPFSGVVRKPIYLLLVRYVNFLFEENHIKARSHRDQNNIRLRLEKLFLLCLRRKNENLRSRSILGNSKRMINPFEGDDGNWIVQNVFKLYGKSAGKLIDDSIVKDYAKNYREEIGILLQFLKREGSLETNRKVLDETIKKLHRVRRKGNLFSGNLLLERNIRYKMQRILRRTLDEGEFDGADIDDLFARPGKAGKWVNRVLVSDSYPFYAINKWFADFTLAVNEDISGATNEKLWKRAGESFRNIRNKTGMKERPNARCWFEKDVIPYKRGKDFNQAGWEALVARAERFKISKVFYDFRTPAVQSLIGELDANAK